MRGSCLAWPCHADKGFGVGHTRDTQTKGVWVWGQPVAKTEADGSTSMVRQHLHGPHV